MEKDPSSMVEIDLTATKVQQGPSSPLPTKASTYFQKPQTRPKIIDRLRFYSFAQSVIVTQIGWHMLFVLIFTTLIVLINEYWLTTLFHDRNSLVPILGLVCGLLLVFRTNTAYDRYYEGRRLWSHMTLNLRTLARWIWILVQEKDAQDLVEKKSAINLLLAYAVAVKHYLREEYSYEYEDLKPLIGHLPKMFAEPSAETLSRHAQSHGHNSSQHRFDKNYSPPTNIPLQLSYYISIYINSVRKREGWDTVIAANLFTGLNGLVESLTGFERIKRTPIPLSYSVHLHHVIWIYILALPIQLVGKGGWWTIPIVTICAFTFIGILATGSDIEDPFDGSTQNDLPLDDLCEVLRSEMNDIMGTTLPTPEELYMNPNYFPLDGVKLNSKELSGKLVNVVREMLKRAKEAKCRGDNAGGSHDNNSLELNEEEPMNKS